MDFGNIENKIVGNADKIGMILGGVGYLKVGVDTDIWRGAEAIITDLINDPHFPNLQHMASSLMHPDSPFMIGIKAAVVGWIAKELDLHPKLNKAGKFAMEAGIGAAEASALVATVAFSGHYHSGEGGGSGRGSAAGEYVRGL